MSFFDPSAGHASTLKRSRSWVSWRAVALVLVCAAVCTLAACAGSPGACREPVGARTLTPSSVADLGSTSGQWVTWGGTLIDTRHGTDRTEFELVSYPLDNCGRPQFDQPSSGRFVVVSPGYVETADIPPGRALTATGRLIGVREGTVAGAAYRFPLLEDPAPRLVPDASGRGWGSRPGFSVGIGAGTGWRGGGIGVYF